MTTHVGFCLSYEWLKQFLQIESDFAAFKVEIILIEKLTLLQNACDVTRQ